MLRVLRVSLCCTTCRVLHSLTLMPDQSLSYSARIYHDRNLALVRLQAQDSTRWLPLPLSTLFESLRRCRHASSALRHCLCPHFSSAGVGGAGGGEHRARLRVPGPRGQGAASGLRRAWSGGGEEQQVGVGRVGRLLSSRDLTRAALGLRSSLPAAACAWRGRGGGGGPWRRGPCATGVTARIQTRGSVGGAEGSAFSRRPSSTTSAGAWRGGAGRRGPPGDVGGLSRSSGRAVRKPVTGRRETRPKCRAAKGVRLTLTPPSLAYPHQPSRASSSRADRARRGRARASGRPSRRISPVPAPGRSRSRGLSDSGRPNQPTRRVSPPSDLCPRLADPDLELTDPARILFQPDSL